MAKKDFKVFKSSAGFGLRTLKDIKKGELVIEYTGRKTTNAAADAAPRFDVVFLDPPFRSPLLEQALPLVAPLLRPGARVYVESAAALAHSAGWRVLRHGRAGQVHYTLVTYGD